MGIHRVLFLLGHTFNTCIWEGTAPVCRGDPADCGPGWSYQGKDKKGDGSTCWSGDKVKCCKIGQ